MIKNFEIKFVNFILVASICCIIISLFSLLWFNYHPLTIFKNCLYYKTTLYNFIYINEWEEDDGSIIRNVNKGQSLVKINREPDNYVIGYIKMFAYYFVYKKKRNNILMLGNAAGSLLIGLLYYIDQNKIKNVNFDVVEIDKEFTKIGEDYFNLPKEDKRVTYYYEDARTFINQDKEKKYDLIFYDIFNGSFCWPYYIITKETFEELFNKLDTDGILLLNAIGTAKSNSDYLRQVYTQLSNIFPIVIIYKENPEQDFGNYVFVAGKKHENNYIELLRKYFEKIEIIKLEKNKEIFTDNYSPVEKYIY